MQAMPTPGPSGDAVPPGSAVCEGPLHDEAARLQALKRLEILDTAPEAPFEAIVELVRQVLNVPICAVSLVDQDRQWFKAIRGLNISETARDISFCTHSILHAATFIVEDAAATPLFCANPLVTGEPHIASYAGAQLTTRDGYNIGTLCAIDTKPRCFADGEIALLRRFANLVITEIEMREMASCDALTGILSRRAWQTCAEREVRHAARCNAPLSFLMIDMDHFKRVNDKFGHAAGDEVLKAVTRIAGSEMRKSDWFGRYGGEEFAVALPGSSMADAAPIANRMRTAIAAMRVPGLGEHRCTMSIGIAGLEPHETGPEPAMARADQALLRAKHAGRNQIRAAA